MIIKMETRDAITEAWGDSQGNNGSKMIREPSWKFIDDLKQVESSVLGDEGQPTPESCDEFYLSVYPNPVGLKRILITAKRKSNGAEIAIVSERRVYLLNDDGKTIERLN